ncbi:magnesium transporter-like [Raphidocelis subcapitata]|uniref:Magnesium transporter n=1 Tax=Raphidocelis subcapitata TaxID=307507 RepID=A0A2V0PLJ2_9CHLO|nr:magnesium transporter-like [Raphidocelis subcapitata]|eukprot:GBF99922.1 magnesium transporter-like [Raphidocelis subcapitata]
MSWLILHQDGSSQSVVMDKRQLTQVMGLEIPMRDLRLMDPALQTWESYAQILVRDNALVVSLEHVRLILSADRVLIPLEFGKNENAERFVKHLEATIRERAAEEAARRSEAAAAAGGGGPGGRRGGGGSGGGVGSGGGRMDLSREGDLDLPFELHMLEVALGEICRHLAQQVATLEALAHPALDALTRNADTVNLERVRHNGGGTATSDVHDLLEVENLLESYFMLVDSTQQKVNAIGEYIDDTEDLINIELDYSRNRLLRLEILITVATFCLALYNLLAGVLGENLVLPSLITQDIWGFVLVNGTALTCCISLFFLWWRAMSKWKMI